MGGPLPLLALILSTSLLAWAAAGPGWAEAVERAAQEANATGTPERYRVWLEEVGPLLSPQEREVFTGLTRDYQRQAFIRRFWEVRDPYPNTPRNEFRERYEERLA